MLRAYEKQGQPADVAASLADSVNRLNHVCCLARPSVLNRTR